MPVDKLLKIIDSLKKAGFDDEAMFLDDMAQEVSVRIDSQPTIYICGGFKSSLLYNGREDSKSIKTKMHGIIKFLESSDENNYSYRIKFGEGRAGHGLETVSFYSPKNSLDGGASYSMTFPVSDGHLNESINILSNEIRRRLIS